MFLTHFGGFGTFLDFWGKFSENLPCATKKLVTLLLWLAQLHWMSPGAGQVTFIELALDFEATVG